VKAETIRFYEREKLLVPPVRTAANYRDYEAEHLSRLTFIRRARELGFTMAQVRELLALSDDRSRCCAAVDAVATAHLAEVEAKISRLQALREELSACLPIASEGLSRPVASSKP
jgi:DNA-binding transcriptional MerR regulator